MTRFVKIAVGSMSSLSPKTFEMAVADTSADERHRNLTNAPLFIDFAGGDFRLQPGSPCIDDFSSFAFHQR